MMKTSQAIAATLVLLGLACHGVVQAQAMKDPTRPPAQFLDPADAAEAATPQASGLQTIKRAGKRRMALLHGEWVGPGDRTGEAVVEKIGDDRVELRYQDGRLETIGMYPEVERHASKAAKRAAGK